MANITIRNIPDEVFERIRSLSSAERRSVNSELLRIIERGVAVELSERLQGTRSVSKTTQLEIWNKLLGEWEDARSTDQIIDDIYNRRTPGRRVRL